MKITWLYRYGSPNVYFNFARIITVPFGIVGCLVSIYGLYSGLFWVPADYQQGDAFRLMYVHVPSAWLSTMIYGSMVFASFIYLIWHIKVSFYFAVAAAPLGAVFTALALLTGSIWGKPIWGAWWVWGDARLLSELILLFIYLLYIVLNSSVVLNKNNMKMLSIVCMIGGLNLPIIHYSVVWWTSLHQPASISLFSSPAIDSSMLYPLFASMIGFTLLFISLVHIKIRTVIIKYDTNFHT